MSSTKNSLLYIYEWKSISLDLEDKISHEIMAGFKPLLIWRNCRNVLPKTFQAKPNQVMATRFNLPHTRWSTECAMQSCVSPHGKGSIHPLFQQEPQALQPSCALPNTHPAMQQLWQCCSGGHEPGHVGHSHLQECSLNLQHLHDCISHHIPQLHFPFTLILDKGQAKQQECHPNTWYLHQGYLCQHPDIPYLLSILMAASSLF